MTSDPHKFQPISRRSFTTTPSSSVHRQAPVLMDIVSFTPLSLAPSHQRASQTNSHTLENGKGWSAAGKAIGLPVRNLLCIGRQPWYWTTAEVHCIAGISIYPRKVGGHLHRRDERRLDTSSPSACVRGLRLASPPPSVVRLTSAAHRPTTPQSERQRQAIRAGRQNPRREYTLGRRSTQCKATRSRKAPPVESPTEDPWTGQDSEPSKPDD
jgi:hypothetical protein